MLDWQTQLFDPIYNSELCVNGTLVSTAGDEITLRVRDAITGLPIPDTRTQIETVRPVAYVRANELSSKNIAIADLPESQIAFNGNTWRIKANRPVPSPMGEAGGEIMLILLSEG